MTTTGEAVIRIRAVGAEQTRAALTGLSNTVRTVAMRDAESSRAATVANATSLRERVAQQQARGRQILQLATTEERERAKVAQRMTREWERSERERVKASERAARDAAAAWDRATRRAVDGDGMGGAGGNRSGGSVGSAGGGLSLGGGLAGLYQGIVSAIQRGMATAGVRDRAEILGAAFDFRTAVETVAGSTGSSFGAVRRSVFDAAEAGLFQPQDIAGALAGAQDLFGPEATGDFVRNSRAIAEAARATGSSFSDLVNVLGALKTNFGVASEDLPALLGGVVELTRNGSIPAGALSRNFQDVFASMSTIRGGRRGVGGALEAVALVESLGGRYDAPSTAAMLSGLFQALGRRDTESALRARGVRLREGGPGTDLRSYADILESLGTSASSSWFDRNAERLGFEGRGAGRALRVIRDNPGALRDILATLDPNAGLGFAAERAAYLGSTPEGRLTRTGIEHEVRTLSDAQRIIDTYRETIDHVTRLGDEFPLLAESMDTLRSTLIGLGVGAGLSRLIFGGGAAALGGGGAMLGAGGGGAALGGGGAMLGAGGLGAGALGLGFGLVGLAAGAAIYGGMRDEVETTRRRETMDRLVRDAIAGGAEDPFAALDLVPGGGGYGRLPGARVSSGRPLGGAFAVEGGSAPAIRLDEASIASLATRIGSEVREGDSSTLGRRTVAPAARR